MAIRSFAGEDVRQFFERGRLRKGVEWGKVTRVAARKLDMLDYATELRDLASPPGNRLEALKGRWRGFHSIRINDQWRICFEWPEGAQGPVDVEIVDYH